MPSFEHTKIVEKIRAIDTPPVDRGAYIEWMKAPAHLEFLQSNSLTNEMIVYGSGEYSFIHSMAVPEELLEKPDIEDLLGWSSSPYTSRSGYVSGGGRDGLWVESDNHGLGSKILEQGTHLVFGRTFEGWSGEDRNYYEVSQDYTHLEEIHWRPEHRSYCRYDGHGDIEHIVSVSKRGDSGVSLVSFDWRALEAYLAASNQLLVRMFDFTLLDRNNFSGWVGEDAVIEASPDLFFRQRLQGSAAFTRGIQIVRLRQSKPEIFAAKQARWSGKVDNEYAAFLAHDFRNKCLTSISTDPNATTNYFDAKDNELPFELSPAFFKPEVLDKYKTDREKYTVGERDVQCRAAWTLRGFDVNEAGQVHAYICDLRKLPYNEQLHWLSFNQEPKAGISQRAVKNDFEGQFVSFEDPLQMIVRILRTWQDKNVFWWKLKEENLFDNVSLPVSSSRDQWGEAFLDLTKLIHEGLVTKEIRKILTNRSVEFDKQEGSVSLLEKLINDVYKPPIEPVKLQGLRTAQFLRTKLKGHSSGSEAAQLAQEAQSEHGSFASHFRHICELIHDELSNIEETFGSA